MAGLLSPCAPARQADAVAAELRLWAATPFIDGKSDCMLSVLAYIERVTGKSLAPRPRYSGRIGGQMYLRRRGGLWTVAENAMEQLGCPRTFDIRRGDVGICWLPGAGDTACIALGDDRWAARQERGAMVCSSLPKRAWAVPAGDISCRKP